MFYRLQVFRAVYEEGGFSKAARRLGLTQSAVSQQIRALEDEFQVALFGEKKRSDPTKAGDYLYHESGRLIASLEDIKRSLLALKGEMKGRVEFGMIDVAAIGLLPNILKKYKQLHPDVDLSAKVRPSGELLAMVEDFSLDFCVAVAHQVGEAFESRSVYKDSIVAIVNKKSPLVNKKEITIDELKGEPLIVYPGASHSRKLIEEHFKGKGIVPTIAMEMHYPAAIISLVSQGMGIGLISELSAGQERLRGLKIVRVKDFEKIREISCLYLKDRRLAPQSKKLIDMIASKS